MGKNSFMISEGNDHTAISFPYPIQKATHHLVSCHFRSLTQDFHNPLHFLQMLPMGCSLLS